MRIFLIDDNKIVFSLSHSIFKYTSLTLCSIDTDNAMAKSVYTPVSTNIYTLPDLDVDARNNIALFLVTLHSIIRTAPPLSILIFGW